MKKIFLIILCVNLFFNKSIISKEQDEPDQIFEGNLSLPSSQQPSPLFCFGQTIVNKNDFVGYGFFDNFWSNKIDYTDFIPYFIYGIRDNLALTVGVPFALRFKDHNCKSSGIEDIYMQLEYAFYSKSRPTYANQATVLSAISFPTGSTKKNPSTGAGSPTIFFGFTVNHMATDWFIFASPGIIFTTGNTNKELGEVFLYQFGVGRNLYYVPKKRILTLTLEFFGATNTKNNRSSLVINKNLITDGFYIGPSLWFATEKFIFNPGISFLASRNGSDDPQNSRLLKYYFAAQLGYKFN